MGENCNVKNFNAFLESHDEIIFGLKLSITNARELLNCAGYSLSPADDLDLLVMFFISQRNFNCMEFDEELYRRGLPTVFS